MLARCQKDLILSAPRVLACQVLSGLAFAAILVASKRLNTLAKCHFRLMMWMPQITNPFTLSLVVGLSPNGRATV